MRRNLVLLLVGVALAATSFALPRPDDPREVTMKKVTPILVVDEIEPALPFWVDRLGFELAAEVQHGERLGFVILAKDGVELMYQTRASMDADVPGIAETIAAGGGLIFIEVADLDAVERALEGVDRLIPRRATPYGAQEIFVREPAGGHVVGFAQFGGD